MKKLAVLLVLAAEAAGGQSPTAAPAGSGPYVAPTSAAYSLLTNAARKILEDVHANVKGAHTLVVYDEAAFANLGFYPSAVESLREATEKMCQLNGQAKPAFGARDEAGVGAVATGLAALIGVTLPAYAIQGQAAKTIDNAALVGALTAEAKREGMTIVNPAYLLQAPAGAAVDCGSAGKSGSFAGLWAAAAAQARKLAGNAGAADTLKAYQAIVDADLAADKGLPIYSKMLQAETLLQSMGGWAQAAVVDVKLDGVGIESTTRTMLWWRITRFSSNVLAHYTILSVQGKSDGTGMGLVVTPGSVNFLAAGMKEKDLGKAAKLAGAIN